MLFRKIKYKNKAFTLAEVLITLLIVGVIASMVIPSLVQNSQDAEFKVAYKKAYAMASLASKQAASNGLFVKNSYVYNFNVFKNQFSVAKECINNNNSQCWNSAGEKACDGSCAGGGLPVSSCPAFVDNSGMAWSLYFTTEELILLDTNGNKAPNRYGKDRWIFAFKDQKNNRIGDFSYKIAPYYGGDELSPDNMACHYPPCYFISWLKD